jgi:hypothetical protein
MTEPDERDLAGANRPARACLPDLLAREVFRRRRPPARRPIDRRSSPYAGQIQTPDGGGGNAPK